MRGADRFRPIELLRVLGIELFDLLLGDVDFALQLPIHDFLTNRLLHHLRVKLRRRETHRAELTVEGFLRASLFLRGNHEFVSGGPGFLFVLFGRLKQEQLRDDESVEQLRLDLLSLVLRQGLSARVQVGLELQEGFIQLTALDFDPSAFAKNIVRKKRLGIRGRVGRVFFGGLTRGNAGGSESQYAQQGLYRPGLHFIFLFPADFNRRMLRASHNSKAITTSPPAHC